MRLPRVLPLLLTIAVIWVLHHPMGGLPALGRLIDPVNGAMAAAEPVDADFSRDLRLGGLQAPVAVWVEDRMVPHIRAGNDHDLYYTQGYLHAHFRLWQMDMQTRAGGGRVSEVVGSRAIAFDRGQRRKGMVLGATRSLAAMEADLRTKGMLDAYRDGINAYIHTLDYRTLPLEYKLMGFYPEDWTNMRTALMAKNLADDLTSRTDDFAYTQLRDQLGQEQFDFLFPERIPGSKPVIPEGTQFAKPSLPIPQYPGDSVWAHFTADGAVSSNLSGPAEEVAKGSNNWAISGSHTASGKPILCNDPHLSLNLPSLWFEMQLTAPGVNSYGASLPGAPGIVIGFNQQISWGFTNNYRDVKDFYEISVAGAATPLPEQARSLSGAEAPDNRWIRPANYLFSGKAVPFERKVEVIKVKDSADIVDTVLYTLHGPVNYDPTFPDPANSGKLIACTWMGHLGSNELLATYLLNRAGDYPAFTAAIQHFECPAQNIVYADGRGNIAMWGQGRFINKWKGQGKYVMEGKDSLTLWGEPIPMEENPHVLNPPQGYVASANQQVTDSTYPYWYNGLFTEWRSWRIHQMLLSDSRLSASKATVSIGAYKPLSNESFVPILGKSLKAEDMMLIQNDVRSYVSYRIREAIRMLDWKSSQFQYQHGQPKFTLSAMENLTPFSENASIFQSFWMQVQKEIWQDEYSGLLSKHPSSERTMLLLVQDTSSVYFDDRATSTKETRHDILTRAFEHAIDSLTVQYSTWQWYNVKNTSLTHLTKIPAFSYDHLKIGGWSNTINAVSGNHGPSWRMIVEMDSIPKAHVVYPGGQSGNPGSPHYGDFIDHWVKGKYFTAQFLTAATTKNPFPYTWSLRP